jgi:hypothetical protein
MRIVVVLVHASLLLLLSSLNTTHAQPLKVFANDAPSVWQHNRAQLPTLLAEEKRPTPSNGRMPETDYRAAREIKRFTAPRILLRGTAEDVGLDGRTLAGFLETQFLEDFAFLQNDFEFDRIYETWEIGLFECEVWTVGSQYPIAFHVQCAGGSMDEPRNWLNATLGYGPKEKITDTVRTTLDSIVGDYATFVRNARSKNGS